MNATRPIDYNSISNKTAARTMLLELQGGRCSICDGPAERGVVDHDHRTGLVRDALCCSCNTRLGAVETGRRTPTDRERTYLQAHGSIIPDLVPRPPKPRRQQTSVCWDIALRRDIAELARRDGRSLNQYVMWVLREHARRAGKLRKSKQ